MKRQVSPQVYARAGGALYLAIILAGLYGEVLVRGSLVAGGDAAATARNIMASPTLFRSGIAGDLIMHVCDVPLTLIFYRLLQPVNGDLSLMAAWFNLIQTAVLAANKLTLVAVALLLGGAGYLKAFEPRELQALAYLPLVLHEYGFGIGLIFFGVRCLIVGYLVYRSTYFPKTLGVLQAVSGSCYLVNTFAMLVAPALANKMSDGILATAFVGEFAMTLWLLFRGVDPVKWQALVAPVDGQRI